MTTFLRFWHYMMSWRRAFQWKHSCWWHFICVHNPDSCSQSEQVLIECFSHTGRSSARVWQKYILHTDECHLFIFLFHPFAVILVGLYKSMQMCTEHKVTYSFALSDVFMHMNPTKDDIQISHISINHSRNQHKKEKRTYFLLLFAFSVVVAHTVSYVPLLLYIWQISVKSIVQLVL